jgi:hypothetical protein
VIDWCRVVAILETVNYRGVLSVECGTELQAADSLKHLQAVLGGGRELAKETAAALV